MIMQIFLWCASVWERDKSNSLQKEELKEKKRVDKIKIEEKETVTVWERRRKKEKNKKRS